IGELAGVFRSPREFDEVSMSVKTRALICALVLSFPFLSSSTANAETLFAIVSERSAPHFAVAAKALAEAAPDQELVFRSVTQLPEISDAELIESMSSADAVLFVSLFGPEANRVNALLSLHP